MSRAGCEFWARFHKIRTGPLSRRKMRLWGFTDGAEKQPEPDCIGEGPLRPAVWKEGQQDYKGPRSPRSQAVPPCRRPADGWAASGTAPPGSRRASYCCSESPPSAFTSRAISTLHFTQSPLCYYVTTAGTSKRDIFVLFYRKYMTICSRKVKHKKLIYC